MNTLNLASDMVLKLKIDGFRGRLISLVSNWIILGLIPASSPEMRFICMKVDKISSNMAAARKQIYI